MGCFHYTAVALVALCVLSVLVPQACGEETQGSCKKYGCSEQFQPGQLCQCNPGCIQEENCCTDYKTVCQSGPPSPAPPGPGKPGHIAWRTPEYGPGTSSNTIDNEAPVITNNTVYFMSASQKYTVYALDAKTGDVKFTVSQPNTTSATAVTVVNGTMYYAYQTVPLYNAPTSPHLRAVCAATGTVKWEVQLPAGQLQDRPILDNEGVLYIAMSYPYGTVTSSFTAPLPATTQPLDAAAGLDDDALEAVNGSCRVYGCGPNFKPNQTCQCNPTCRDYSNCCPDYCNVCPPPSPPPPPPPHTFVAVRADYGTYLWSTNVSASETSAAVGNNGLVYVSDGTGSVYAFNTSRESLGVLVWTTRNVGNEWSTPVVAEGMVFTSLSSGVLHALDALTGRVKWNATFEGYNALAPTVEGETLYIAGAFPTLYAFNIMTGKAMWNTTLGYGHLWSFPYVDAGKVYIGSDDGHLFVLDATTGKQAWNFTAPESVRSAVVSNGLVYFGTNSHMSPGSEDQLFALETA
eukprot:m.170467 g.170467  ORF g.170467 m.170467 type:complete len:518 (-) comp13247_c0_seq1:127-1680(-)